MFTDINSALIIDWYYEDDDTEMFEVGKDLQRLIDCEFNLIPLDSF